MAYVPVPKDLSKIKTKVAFNLTKRQIVCFAVALIVGLPLFFLLKDSAGTSAASFVMIVVMLPCFLMAMYEKHGQPLEVVVKNIIQTKFVRPKERPYNYLRPGSRVLPPCAAVTGTGDKAFPHQPALRQPYGYKPQLFRGRQPACAEKRLYPFPLRADRRRQGGLAARG